ncbi:hypothetical protein BDP55DRAFT_42328 [Colletotrichum godetiae]|uniref:Cytochrome P450 n=1 Tax=Colletotrichum godetiae TaxID=1209918 RepID=A0AAJ0A5V9_9PEZI|nr:uncharacterized protein BDP55DRAFT_42328 [Colletotrichum godetiae]KAK1657057.1 hypothetical protein BDP55DRAFT_42328 [Colletotrichum godetiae]
MEATLELVFGHGKWKCLGRNVAMMELQKIFVELLRRFDLVLCDPTRPWKSLNYGIFLQSQYWLRAYKLPQKRPAKIDHKKARVRCLPSPLQVCKWIALAERATKGLLAPRLV